MPLALVYIKYKIYNILYSNSLELLYRVFYTPTHGQKHGATQRIASQHAEVIVKQKKEKNAPPITTLSHTH